jgi:hypothetical protein
VDFFGLHMRRLYQERANKQNKLYLQNLKDIEPSLLFFFHAGFLRQDYGDAWQTWADYKKVQLENPTRPSAETSLSPDLMDQIEGALAASDTR